MAPRTREPVNRRASSDLSGDQADLASEPEDHDSSESAPGLPLAHTVPLSLILEPSHPLTLSSSPPLTHSLILDAVTHVSLSHPPTLTLSFWSSASEPEDHDSSESTPGLSLTLSLAHKHTHALILDTVAHSLILVPVTPLLILAPSQPLTLSLSHSLAIWRGSLRTIPPNPPQVSLTHTHPITLSHSRLLSQHSHSLSHPRTL